jgi:hypothetical protein
MIILPLDLTSEEIRVLQEFRRLNAETLGLETIKALKHPTGPAGEAPALSLAEKGWLETDGSRAQFTLLPKAKDFLAIDAKPMFEEAPAPGKTSTPEEEIAVEDGP